MKGINLGLNELQQGIFNLLNGAVIIDNFTYPVYDEVPQDQNNPPYFIQPPYIVIGDDISTPWAQGMSKIDFARHFSGTITVFSKKQQFKELKDILQAISDLIITKDDTAGTITINLAIAGFQIIYLQIHASASRDQDGRTRVGTLTLEIDAKQT